MKCISCNEQGKNKVHLGGKVFVFACDPCYSKASAGLDKESPDYDARVKEAVYAARVAGGMLRSVKE